MGAVKSMLGQQDARVDIDPAPSVGVLGRLELMGPGGLVHLRRRKARQLLLMLVVHRNQMVTRSALVDVLWPGSSPSDPLASVRSYASMVHRTLEHGFVPHQGPAIVAKPTGYLLRLGDQDLDAAQLTVLVDRADELRAAGTKLDTLSCVDRALALVRGVPFEDALGQPFVESEVHRIESLTTRARELRLEIQLELGWTEQVIGGARELLAEDPYREGVWELYARSLARSGRGEAARAAVEKVRAQLQVRFGVEIGPSLSAVLRDLQAPENATRCPGPRMVPAGDVAAVDVARPSEGVPFADGALVGRDRELGELRTLLETEQLVTVVGPAGVGKTRLAIEAIDVDPVARVPCWCDLAGAGTDADVVRRVASAFRWEVDPALSLDELVSLVARKQVLVVLDTCDPDATAAARVVDHLLSSCPGLTVLATSRVPLHLARERVLDVGPLLVASDPDADRADPLSAPATALLWTRYVEAGGSDDLDSMGVALARLARITDGVPLAIELLALELVSESPERASRSRRHTTMRDAIDWSFQAASGREQRALQLLADLEGPFTLGTALSAVASAGCSTAPLVSVLRDLIDSSLLEVREVDGTSTYRLPDALHAYVMESKGSRRRATAQICSAGPVAAGPPGHRELQTR